MHVTGLAPYLNPQRPREAARWWRAAGTVEKKKLRISSLQESAALPGVEGRCGLAAPCSLPRAFLDHLGAQRSRDVALPAGRLLVEARAFAAKAQRGRKHPPRDPHESSSVLDRRRLPLFAAALPLLRREQDIFEVDVASVLRALELPATGLTGTRPSAVDRRVRVLQALHEGVLAFPVDLRARDYAVASAAALRAVVAATVALWVAHDGVPARRRRDLDPGAVTPLPRPRDGAARECNRRETNAPSHARTCLLAVSTRATGTRAALGLLRKEHE